MQDLRSGDAAGGHEVDGGEGGGEAARGGEAEESVLERLKVGRGAARGRTVDATKNRPKACKVGIFSRKVMTWSTITTLVAPMHHSHQRFCNFNVDSLCVGTKRKCLTTMSSQNEKYDERCSMEPLRRSREGM